MHFNPDNNNINGTLAKFESMLKSNKPAFFDSSEFEDIIIHYLDQGKATLAKRALKFALEQHPECNALQLAHAEILIYEDKTEQAERILYNLLKLEPFNEEIYIQIANIYSKKDQHLEAIEQLKIAAKYTDDLADVYNLMGMEYLFMDQLEEAKSCFLTCLNSDVDDQTALYNVIYCFEFLDQIEEAILFLETYINKNPYSQVAWHQQGRLLYDIKKYQEALTAFDFAFIIDEYFVGAIVEKGKCYEKLKMYQEAIACYLYAIELEEGSSYVYLRLGKCFEKINDLQKAVSFYNKATKEDPLLDKAWIIITDFYIKNNNYRKALYYIKKGLEIDTENAKYWERYIKINFYLGNYEEVIYGYDTLKNIKPKNSKFFMMYADSHILINDIEKAIGILIEAHMNDTKNLDYSVRLAGLLIGLNENEYGFKFLNDIISHNEPIYIERFKNMFPSIYDNPEVQNFINKNKS